MTDISMTEVILFWLGLFLIIGYLIFDDKVIKANDREEAHSYAEAIVSGTKWGCVWGCGTIIALVAGLALLYYVAVTS